MKSDNAKRSPLKSAYLLPCLVVLLALCLLGMNSANAQARARFPRTPPTEAGSSPANGEAKNASTEINAKNADIAAIVKIFSKITKRNYILDERVKGKVTIYLPGKVTDEEALRILDSVLAFKGFTTVPISENLWKILPSKDARQTTIPTLLEARPGEPSATVVTRLIHLKFIQADEMKQLITPLVSGDGLLNAYAGTNSLILVDSEDNINRLEKLIETIDVPFSDRDLTIIPVVNADAVDIANKLNEILGLKSAESGKGDQGGEAAQRLREIQDTQIRTGIAPPGVPPGVQPVSAAQVSGKTVGARIREPKIIPDERTNAIIVLADEDLTARIRALISQLDSKLDLSGNRFYVYRCQHASADELAQTLAGLVGEGGGSKGTSGSKSGLGESGDLFGGSSGGSSKGSLRSSQSSRSQQRLASQNRSPGQSLFGGERSSAGTVKLGENISVTADRATNSLIIVSSKTDFQKIKSLLDQLDIKRRQVSVDAILLEVDMTDSQALGFDFLTSAGGADGGIILKNDSGNLASFLTNPGNVTGLAAAAASAGTITLPNGKGTIPTHMGLVTALRSNGNVNVLSAPTLLATDNQEAEIVVGTNVPLISSVSTNETNLNNTFNQVDRQDVGITLRLTPQISSEDFVTLKIFTEVSNVDDASASANLGPSILTRTSQTTVITKDSQMIAIGGLMGDDVKEGSSGIPFLQDIPVLGYLFRTDKSQRRRTNLLIFITPHIIKDQFDARDVTLAQRDQMESAIDYSETSEKRTEVMRHPALDRVTESRLYDGPKPSAIRPPENQDSQASATRPELLPPDGSSQSDEEIELKVPARLPDETPDGPGKASLRPSLKTTVVSKVPPLEEWDAQDGAIFVVLSVDAGSRLVDSAPIGDTSKGALLGLIVPAGSSNRAKSFFSSGEYYKYTLQGQSANFTVLGSFDSLEAARTAFPRPEERWYTLSPREIMNLGQGPWSKAPGSKAAKE